MKIETKYEIGDKIWIVYEGNHVVELYDDVIAEIGVDEDKNIIYYTSLCEDLKEDEIILYDEKDKLLQTIKELMKNIKEKEKNEE